MKEQRVGLDMDFSEALKRFTNVNTKDVVEKIDTNITKASPLVKWVGGKRSIINELKTRLPRKINTYHEAFIGGGALFFELCDDIEEAHLLDNNLDLVIMYNVVKKDPKKLIKLLKSHDKNHCEDYYYKIRSQHELQDPIELAARLLYLNKTCFNGLFRVNKKGEFNVPMGKYKNPNIVQENNILACNKVLQKATITYGDFSDINPNSGDFVYFDPPYHPINKQSFTTYTKSDFNEVDQNRLRDFLVILHSNEVNTMLSNSNTEFIQHLYKSSIFNVSIVNAPRHINCKPNKRNPVEEVLITNYKNG